MHVEAAQNHILFFYPPELWQNRLHLATRPAYQKVCPQITHNPKNHTLFLCVMKSVVGKYGVDQLVLTYIHIFGNKITHNTLPPTFWLNIYVRSYEYERMNERT